ncbi:MAG: hypothetical protein QOG62_1364 [Thermoleophilaceae bacterium]|nr:hypothetical protein [Thermoleophilaceae bacterium]
MHRLRELSSDVLAAVLLGPDGVPLAQSSDDDALSENLGRLAGELVSHATAAGARQDMDVVQLEVSTAAGMVFAVRETPPGAEAPWALAVVARRLALPSLMFMDLRHVIAQLEPAAAA